MKHLVIVLTIMLALMAAGCGTSSSNSNSVSGNWTAALTGSGGSPSFNFMISLVQNSDTTVSGTSLNFTTTTPCFTQGGTTASGGFAITGNLNGTTSGALTLTVQSISGTNNTLNMQGTANNNSVTGTWTLTGTTSGCAGSGTFSMQR